MRRRRNAVTTAGRFRQASLFTSEQMKPFLKNRWQWIMDRIREEDRQNARQSAPDAQTAPGGTLDESEDPPPEKERA